MSFFLSHSVTTRVARLTYGCACARVYDQLDPEHVQRSKRVYTRPSGRLVVPDAFEVVLGKVRPGFLSFMTQNKPQHTQGTRMAEDAEFRQSFFREAVQATTLDSIFAGIVCYRGKTEIPHWMDEESGGASAVRLVIILSNILIEYFSEICTVYADTSKILKNECQGSKGVYYTQEFDVVLLGGHTELKALISWQEDVSRQL